MPNNNFTPLRLALALLVMCAHYRWLGGGDYRQLAFPFIYGGFAVQCFFVVSGYLVAGSFDRDPNLYRFYVRRLCRIYPLYLVVVAAQTVIMAALAPGGIGANAEDLASYFAANAVFANFLKHDVGGVLSNFGNPSLNASLWTLKIEVAFYAILPAIWLIVKRWGLWVLVPIFFASALYFELLARAGHYDLAKQLPGELQYFVLGIAGFALRDRIKFGKAVAYAAMIGVMIVITWLTIADSKFPVIYPLLVGAFVLVTALRVPPVRFSTDISFGVYLFHAPVIQLSILVHLYRGDWIGLMTTVFLVVSLALVAERYVETPGIKLGHRLTRRPAAVPVHPYSP